MDSIFSLIRNEVQDFVENDIEIVQGWMFNTYNTIKRCHLYQNSQFEDNSLYNGQPKLFVNIGKYRAKVASRLLNVDTKNIRLLPMNPRSRFATLLLSKEMELWMKLNKTGMFLNDIVLKSPVYGTSIFKKTKKGARVEDLRRLAYDPTVKCINESRFIITRSYLTDGELRKRSKENGWDKEAVKEVIEKDKHREKNAPYSYPMDPSGTTNVIRSTVYHEIDERFGEVPKSWLTGKESDSEEFVMAVFIVANAGWVNTSEDNYGNIVTSENGVVLFKGEWKKKLPFGQYNYDSTEGRLLGVGVWEDLFPAQERKNEMANQKRVSMNISSKHLFQTQDQTIVQNILTDLESGDVIRTGMGGITPIANEDRNLNSFASEEAQYDMLADRLSFATDVARGEALPASTPATNAAIQNTNSQSEFTFRRENLCLVLQEFFNEQVLPQLLEDLTPEHVLRFAGTAEDLESFDNEYSKILADEMIASGKVQVEGEADRIALTEQLKSELKKQGKERFVNIKEKLYNDIEFEFDINITNEQKDVTTAAQNMFTVLNAIGNNPGLLDNPVTKTLIFKWAEILGISPLDLEYKSQQVAPAQAMPGMHGQGAPEGMPAAPIESVNPQIPQANRVMA